MNLSTQADPGTDYALLSTHTCTRRTDVEDGLCGGGFSLRSYPVDGGFVVAVCCDRCRDETGLPSRYSVETGVLGSFEEAENKRKSLLTQQKQNPVNTKNVYPRNNGYQVRFNRDGKQINIGSFKSIEDAIKVRDAFLEETT